MQMPKLETSATSLVKMLLIGESGSGKTGALVGLAMAGYKLHILDFDNKIAGGILPIALQSKAPDKMALVDYEPLRDNFKPTAAGPIINGSPSAFTKSMALLDKWSDGTAPKDWGPEHVLVVDSLTFL